MDGFNITPGMIGEARTKVSEENTALKYGSGSVNVFGTPAMIALMEEAAINTVDKFLPEGMATVGTHLEINHIAATPIGMNVTASAKLKSIEGKKLFFEVEAFDEREKIGFGSHYRYIINLSKFIEKAASKK